MVSVFHGGIGVARETPLFESGPLLFRLYSGAVAGACSDSGWQPSSWRSLVQPAFDMGPSLRETPEGERI